MTLQRIDVKGAADFDEAFATVVKGRAEALVVVQSTIFETSPYRIQRLATSNRVPAIYGLRTSADAGGLISYGPNVPDLYRYAAVYVDKILKGARPADLPVEQPTKFELVINLKTAKALGLTIPPVAVAARGRGDSVMESAHVVGGGGARDPRWFGSVARGTNPPARSPRIGYLLPLRL